MRKLVLPILILAWTFTPVTSKAANIVDNSSFESGLAPWSVTGLYTISMVYHHDGSRAMLGGGYGNPTTISQTIATIPGQRYTLSFWLMNLSRYPPTLTQVSWGPETVLTLTDQPFWVPSVPSSELWHNYVVPSLEATGTSTVLSFTIASNSGLCLDAVSLEPIEAGVPEPASAVLLGAALFVVFGLRRTLFRLRSPVSLRS